jgi:hypothetical protein
VTSIKKFSKHHHGCDERDNRQSVRVGDEDAGCQPDPQPRSEDTLQTAVDGSPVVGILMQNHHSRRHGPVRMLQTQQSPEVPASTVATATRATTTNDGERG